MPTILERGAADVLERAANMLEERELAKGRLIADGNGRAVRFGPDQAAKAAQVCARGAILLAGGRRAWTPETRLADAAVERQVGEQTHAWNDREETTKADVVVALRQAATTLRSDGDAFREALTRADLADAAAGR